MILAGSCLTLKLMCCARPAIHAFPCGSSEMCCPLLICILIVTGDCMQQRTAGAGQEHVCAPTKPTS
jgi:hypothetical protein